ncbi:DUF808 domain-containing protein [Mucilaginibacter koreensis]
MASGIFAILDDITALMDDVAVAAKVATRKTAGILGDDLAVNAEKATGFMATRELPVLWAITKGSLLNKLIIVPVALLLNAFLPASITWLLVAGGLYLAYEAAEKIIGFLFHHSKEKHAEPEDNKGTASTEQAKIKSAIATDFILSIEIVIIALGSVTDQVLWIQIVSVAIVAVLATIGVYGLVALMVRMDDAGYKLIKSSDGAGFIRQTGKLLVAALPVLIKILSVVGTLALLLVSGGIFVHHIAYIHHLMSKLPSTLAELIIGMAAGLLVFAIVESAKWLWGKVNAR